MTPRNIFASSPVRPPVDAVSRLRSLLDAGIPEEEARRIIGREIDRRPPEEKRKVNGNLPESKRKPAGVVLSPVERSPRETPVSPSIANRFRPATQELQQPAKFDTVAHYALANPQVIGQTTKRGEIVPVLIGYTNWDQTDDRARFNGTIHVAGLGQTTINLSFDALAGLTAAAPKIEAYLAHHGPAIANAEAVAVAARKERRR